MVIMRVINKNKGKMEMLIKKGKIGGFEVGKCGGLRGYTILL